MKTTSLKTIISILLTNLIITNYLHAQAIHEAEKQSQNRTYKENEKAYIDSLLSTVDSFYNYESFIKSIPEEKLPLSKRENSYLEFIYQSKSNNVTSFILLGEEILRASYCSKSDSIFVYKTLGFSLQKQGFIRHALEYEFDLHAVLESDDRIELKEVWHRIGLLYYEMKDYKKAIFCFKKSLIMKVPDKPGLTHTYQIMNNLGLSYSKIQELDSAAYYYQKVVDSIESKPKEYLNRLPNYLLSLVKGNLGVVYMEQGKYEKALPLLVADLEKSEEFGLEKISCRGKVNLAKLYLNLKELDKAKILLDEAILTSNLKGYFKEKAEAYLVYAYYYAERKDYRKSSEYFNRHSDLEDSLKLKSSNRNIADYQLELFLNQQKNEFDILKLESTKNKAELKARKQQLIFSIGLATFLVILISIMLLNYKKQKVLNNTLLSKNLEINKRGEELMNALNEKNLMMKEIHHRVKNNLQLVQSLLRLQSEDVKNEIVSRAFKESINRLTSMSLIHQKLYQEEKLKEIEFKAYMESFISYLHDSYMDKDKLVEIKLDSLPFEVSLDKAIPLALIINELINNAFKHAFVNKKDGTIIISMEKSDSRIKVSIIDNGIGLNDNFKINTDSFGINLINILVNQIEGEINFFNQDGANFEVTFKDSATA